MNVIQPELEKEIELETMKNAKSHPPVASVYFKFSHRDQGGKALSHSK